MYCTLLIGIVVGCGRCEGGRGRICLRLLRANSSVFVSPEDKVRSSS